MNIEWRREWVLINGLYSFPHFLYLSHSSVVGIERTLPINGYFLGPGGRFRPWRWPFIQYTIKAVRVQRPKASWVTVICEKVLNYDNYFDVSGFRKGQICVKAKLCQLYHVCFIAVQGATVPMTRATTTWKWDNYNNSRWQPSIASYSGVLHST